jgi:hypothetical protein
MTDIRKITKDGVCDQVYKQLKDNVLKGSWQPGTDPSKTSWYLFSGSATVDKNGPATMITQVARIRGGNGTYVAVPRPSILTKSFPQLKPKLRVEFRKALETEALKP